MSEKDLELEKVGTHEVVTANEPIMGFEEANQDDVVIPRVKVINALSPERQDGIANEGDVLNSLTKEVILPEHNFIPLKVTYSNIAWVPKSEGDGIECRAMNGKIGVSNIGNGTLVCDRCKRNEFDNSKQGKASQPTCTKYINFLGFFEHDLMPVVLSFSRTNYNEGKKLLSIAKSMRDNMFNHTYSIGSRLQTKDKNKWYNITTKMTGDTSEEMRAFARNIYGSLQEYEVDLENTAYNATNDDNVSDAEMENAGF